MTQTSIDSIRPVPGYRADTIEQDASHCARGVAVYRHEDLDVPAEEALAVVDRLVPAFVPLMRALDAIGGRLAEQRIELEHRAFQPQVTEADLVRYTEKLVPELEDALADAREAQAAAEKLVAGISPIPDHG